VRCYISDGVDIERYDERHRRGLPPVPDPAAFRGRRPTAPG
jgi:hypothetical protein